MRDENIAAQISGRVLPTWSTNSNREMYLSFNSLITKQCICAVRFTFQVWRALEPMATVCLQFILIKNISFLVYAAFC